MTSREELPLPVDGTKREGDPWSLWIHTHSPTSSRSSGSLLGRPLMLKSVANQGLLCTLLAWLGPSALSSLEPLGIKDPWGFLCFPSWAVPHGFISRAYSSHSELLPDEPWCDQRSCPPQCPVGHHTEVAILNKPTPSFFGEGNG